MAEHNPNLRAVPNPSSNGSDFKDLVKTVALTSAVSTVVGVFALAGGQAIYRVIKRAIRRDRPVSPPSGYGGAPTRQQMDEYMRSQGYEPADINAPPEPPEYYEPAMPEALKMRPNLRPTGRRRRGPAAATASSLDELRQMLAGFEERQNNRFSEMEKKIADLYEEDIDDEDDDEEDDD